MPYVFKTLRASTAILCLAALLLLAPQLVQAQAQQGRMNLKKVAVTSNAPVAQVEAVDFSGQALIESRLASDPDFGKPSLILLIDLTGVTGIGAQSRTTYVLSSEEYIVRPHASNQVVEFTFPMATDENAPIDRIRSGSARFAMNIDLSTGAVTSVAAVLVAR